MHSPPPLRFYMAFLVPLVVCLIGGCGAFSSDPSIRTPGTRFDDAALQRIAKRRIRNAGDAFAGAHVSTASHYGVVLLTGQVPNRTLKHEAGELVRSMAKVRRVHNELTVGGVTAFLARTNDRWLGMRVKSKLRGADDVKSNHIKVVAENGTVFLLGRVSRAEGEAATAAAGRVRGVQKIVKVFEYLEATAADN